MPKSNLIDSVNQRYTSRMDAVEVFDKYLCAASHEI